jgi:hypothetical protein
MYNPCWMDVGWMHWPYFVLLVYKQRSKDYIAYVGNGVEQTNGLDKSKVALGMSLVTWISLTLDVRPMA